MRTLTVNQQYILTVNIDIEVEDDWTDKDIVEFFRDYPVNVTVEQMLDIDSPLNEGVIYAEVSDVELTTAESDAPYAVIENGRILNASV